MADAGTRILMVEDSESLVLIYRAYLEKAGYDVLTARSLSEARDLLDQLLPDIVLLDVELPDGSGLGFLPELARRGEAAGGRFETIVMTVHGSSDMAVRAIDEGAFDFLTKPFDSARLLVTVNNARDHLALNRRVAALRGEARDRYGPIIGASPPMQSIYRVIDAVAPCPASVFIRGESGTGKELAAEAVHRHSDRKDGPFFALNCAAIPGELVESELFGHVKGAFTGATGARDGAATMADGGTLFLDELCEMSLENQKKLLRFVQSGTFQRVGSSRTERVDVRFVCATNRDPFAEVEAGRFREDLLYRLHVVPLELPPLRARGEDVLLIARAALAEFSARYGKRFGAFESAVEAALLEHDWPGNVRELRNLVERLVALHDGEVVTARMLPERLGDDLHPGPPPTAGGGAGGPGAARVPASTPPDDVPVRAPARGVRPLAEVEREAIEHAIEACAGSVSRAAGLLEVAPSTLYRKLRAWGR